MEEQMLMIGLAGTPEAGEGVSIITGGEVRGCGLFGPQGYCWRPEDGQELLVGALSGRPVGLGTPLPPAEGLLPGEVRIAVGGGYIHWKRDGEIEINSLRITRDGQIIKKED